ncbi:MAG: GTP cyclohydrolase II, partial [Alphaproteobacteria bacterium]|nr:GTP cyclohydrolase II [Alphaproteobacteria bacterium]
MAETSRDILRRVHQANGALRAGQPVLIHPSTAGGPAYLCAAAESVSEDTLALMRRQQDKPLLAFSANRAAVLHIAPTGDETICAPLPKSFGLRDLQQLADPTHDLDNPFRGPLKRLLAQSPEAVSAAVDACKRALLLPVAVCVSWPGKAPEGVVSVNEDDIAEYEKHAAHSLHRIASARVPLKEAENARVIAFRPEDGGIEHLAIVVGELNTDKPVLVRLHSECFTGDLLGSLKCDCG